MANPNDLLAKYFEGEALDLIMTHGTMVSGLALSIGQSLFLPDTDCTFLHEASMLHDIGICRVHAPGIGMHGNHPYMMHGVLGREILEAEGLPRHALVCERHIGVGLTAEDIKKQKLPLPKRDMLPQDTCEEIICFADLFYSKTPGRLEKRKQIEDVRRKLAVFGEEKARIFDTWVQRFGKGIPLL